MLQNAYFLAKIGADTAENEQHVAEILPKTSNYPTGPPGRPGSHGAISAAPGKAGDLAAGSFQYTNDIAPAYCQR